MIIIRLRSHSVTTAVHVQFVMQMEHSRRYCIWHTITAEAAAGPLNVLTLSSLSTSSTESASSDNLVRNLGYAEIPMKSVAAYSARIAGGLKTGLLPSASMVWHSPMPHSLLKLLDTPTRTSLEREVSRPTIRNL